MRPFTVSPRRAARRKLYSAVAKFSPVETLEDRRLMSFTVVAQGTLLSIVGDDKPNQISVVIDSSSCVVVCDGATQRFSFGASNGGGGTAGGGAGKVVFSDLSIVSKGGNDHVVVQSSLSLNFTKIEMKLDGGKGDDSLFVRTVVDDATAGASSVSISCVGGEGDDDIDSSLSLRSSAQGTHIKKAVLFMDGANGDDAITCRVLCDDSAVSSPPAADSTWTVSSTIRGGNGDDVVDEDCDSLAMSDYFLKIDRLTDTGAGDDTAICSFSFGASNPTSVSSTGGAGSGRSSFTQFLRGGLGDDVLDTSVDAEDVDKSSPILARTGVTCSITCDAGYGNDEVTSRVTDDTVARVASIDSFTWKCSVLSFGGVGDDQMTCIVSPRDPASGLPTGKLSCVVDGGDGTDSAFVSGSVVQTRNCEDVTDIDSVLQ